MKNQFKTIAAVLFICGLSLGVKAQSERSSGIRYSIGAEGGLPVGKLADNYQWSLGGSVQADIPVYKNELYITLNAGYLNIFGESKFGKSIDDVQLLPVKAGLKYFPVYNLYFQGEAGVSFLLNESPQASKSATFVYAPQIGYLIPLGSSQFLDAGVRFEGNTKFYGAGSSNNLLGLRIAYAFPL